MQDKAVHELFHEYTNFTPVRSSRLFVYSWPIRGWLIAKCGVWGRGTGAWLKQDDDKGRMGG